MVTVRPITFHPKRFTQFKVNNVSSNLRFTQFTFHPFHVSPKLHLQKSFIRYFFNRLKHIAHEFIAWFPIITHKPLDRFASNSDCGFRENVLRLVNNSNLSGLTYIYKQSWVPDLVIYFNANCCKSSTFLFEICKPHNWAQHGGEVTWC